MVVFIKFVGGGIATHHELELQECILSIRFKTQYRQKMQITGFGNYECLDRQSRRSGVGNRQSLLLAGKQRSLLAN